MKMWKRKLPSIVLSIVMAAGLIFNHGILAQAAGSSITPQISDSKNEQKFILNAATPGTWYSSTGESGDVEAGTTTIIIPTSEEMYVEFTGADAADDAFANSINMYYVPVNFQAQDGSELMAQEKVTVGLSNEVEYEAPASLSSADGATIYSCSSNVMILKYGDTSHTFVYSSEALPEIGVPIYYTDSRNNRIGEDRMIIPVNGKASFTAKEELEADGKKYKLADENNTVTMEYNSASASYTFQYHEAEKTPVKPYSIDVNLKDQGGEVLYNVTMTIDVNGKGMMELPSSYYLGAKVYQLAEGQPKKIEHNFTDPRRTYDIVYDLTSEAIPYELTFNLVNAETGAVIETTKNEVKPGESFRYDLASKATFERNNKVYVLCEGQGEDGAVSHQYGDASKAYNIYYTENEAGEAGSYPVTLRLINVTSNEILESKEQTVAAGETAEFEVSPSMKMGGTDFVLLKGQDTKVIHAYNDQRTTYAVYYRDAKDVLNEETVVTEELVTQYIPNTDAAVPAEPTEEVVIEPLTVQIADLAASEAAQAVPEGNVPVTPAADNQLRNEEGTPVTLENGVLIQDEQVPLANKKLDEDTADKENGAKEEKAVTATTAAFPFFPAAAGVIVLLIALLLIYNKKKAAAQKSMISETTEVSEESSGTKQEE